MISMYPKAEILFPPKLIPTLKNLRGPEWARLVEEVSRLPEAHPDALAFCLMMIELDGCLNCYAGSYKFMRGCAACARQTISQYKGGDADLVQHFRRAQGQIRAYLEGKAVPTLASTEEVISVLDEELDEELATELDVEEALEPEEEEEYEPEFEDD